MREKTIELQLARAVKKIGGMCPKFVSPGTDGMPDRLVLLPGARIAFVEVKSLGKKPRPLQVMRHQQLRSLGFPVFVLDDPEAIPGIIADIKGGRELGRKLSETGECHHIAGGEGLQGRISEDQAFSE